jgi:hypothetical protein
MKTIDRYVYGMIFRILHRSFLEGLQDGCAELDCMFCKLVICSVIFLFVVLFLRKAFIYSQHSMQEIYREFISLHLLRSVFFLM